MGEEVALWEVEAVLLVFTRVKAAAQSETTLWFRSNDRTTVHATSRYIY